MRFPLPARFFICSMILAMLSFPLAAGAATTPNVLVKAQLPDNQQSTKTTYFDLRMEPGQKQTVSLSVTNPGDTSLVINTDLHAAATGRNGIVDYTGGESRDSSMELSINDVAHVLHPEITLEPGETSAVQVSIALPAAQFDGMLLGGLHVTASLLQEPDEQPQGGIQLENQFAYVIGLKITQNDEPVFPHLSLAGIEPGLTNHRNSVLFHLQNPQPVLMKDMTVNAEIWPVGREDDTRTLALDYAEMAPNSTGEFVVAWGSNAIAAGQYRFHAVATWQDEVWEWDEPFTIGSSTAQDMNNQAVGVTRFPWLGLFYFLVFLLLLVLLAYYLERRSRNRRRAVS